MKYGSNYFFFENYIHSKFYQNPVTVTPGVLSLRWTIVKLSCRKTRTEIRIDSIRFIRTGVETDLSSS